MFANIHGRNQIFAAVVVSFAYASVGCNFAWTSPTLPRLLDKNSVIPITEEQGSWVASILAIGATISPLLSCKLLDVLGRKKTLLLNSVLLLVGWIFIGLASCVEMLCLGRLINGLACGIFFLGLPMYVAEITEDSLRGALSCGNELAIAFGCNLEYFVGPYLSYKTLVMVSMIPPVIFILIFLWIPESPYYLISKGYKDKAIKSLQWFRGNISKENAEKESVIILSTMYEQMQKKTGVMDLFQIPGNRKGLGINLFLVTAGQFTGINVIQLYSELIFMKSQSNIPPKYCAMTVGTFQLISSLFAPSVSKIFGYRKPLLVAAVIIGTEHLFMGLYFYFDHLGHDMTQWGWLPVTCLVIFMLTFSSTYGPIPWAVLGETFPTNVKVIASALATSLCLLDTFILTKFFTNISEVLGIYWGFWIFSISMMISFIFIFILLPETKGMSLQEIQDILNRQKPLNNDKV